MPSHSNPFRKKRNLRRLFELLIKFSHERISGVDSIKTGFFAVTIRPQRCWLSNKNSFGCLDGYEVHGVVWNTPGTRKATATGTCTYFQLLSHYTRAPKAGRMRPEEAFAKRSYKYILWNAWSLVLFPRGHSLFVFNPAIMIVLYNMPILMPVVQL